MAIKVLKIIYYKAAMVDSSVGYLPIYTTDTITVISIQNLLCNAFSQRDLPLAWAEVDYMWESNLRR